MLIKDLKPKQGNAEVEAVIVDKGEIREFNKFGKVGRVCNAKIKDSSGTIALTLWNEQIEQVHLGDKIKITNGYVNEWQGEMQLTTGKFGKLEIIESKGVTSDEETESNLLKGKTSDEGEHVLTDDEELESDELDKDLDSTEYEDID